MLASGAHDWENRFEDGYWTYRLDDAWAGIQDAYAKMAAEVKEKTGETVETIGALGFGHDARLSAVRRRGQPARGLPHVAQHDHGAGRGGSLRAVQLQHPPALSVAHLYQAILNGEEHTSRIDYLTTLAGYIHWKLTGRKVMGVGEASGMFPIDSETGTYDADMLAKFRRDRRARHARKAARGAFCPRCSPQARTRVS